MAKIALYTFCHNFCRRDTRIKCLIYFMFLRIIIIDLKILLTIYTIIANYKSHKCIMKSALTRIFLLTCLRKSEIITL